MRYTKGFFVLLGVLALVVTACAPQATPTPAPTPTAEMLEEPTAEESAATEAPAEAMAEGELPVLDMALIPVLDVLPFFVAQEEGYFEEEGVQINFVPVSSALEREQLMTAGEVDGVLTDVIGPAITNAAADPSVTIVAMARKAYEDAPLFRILAAPDSGIETAADLAGVPVGISENSVIQYLGDRLLTHAGLAMDDIAYESIPSIPNRFGLMMEGQLSASILPDPLAQAAIDAGAILVVDDTVFAGEEYAQSVLSFRNETLENNPDAVRAFLRAWNRAVEALNANPDDYRQLWLDNTNPPESVQETYTIPPFPLGEITSEAVWDDVSAWLVERGIIDEAASYEDSVDASYLP